MDPETITLLVQVGASILAGLVGALAHKRLTSGSAATPAASSVSTAPSTLATPAVSTNPAVAARFPAIHALFHAAQSTVANGAANGFPVLTQIEDTLMSGMAGGAATSTSVASTMSPLEQIGLQAMQAALKQQLSPPATAQQVTTLPPSANQQAATLPVS